jgi:hypothetical protein
MDITEEHLESFRTQLEAKGFHCANCNASAGFITPVSYLGDPRPDTKGPLYAVTVQCQKCRHSAMTGYLTAPTEPAN